MLDPPTLDRDTAWCHDPAVPQITPSAYARQHKLPFLRVWGWICAGHLARDAQGFVDSEAPPYVLKPSYVRSHAHGGARYARDARGIRTVTLAERAADAAARGNPGGCGCDTCIDVIKNAKVTRSQRLYAALYEDLTAQDEDE